MTALCSMLEHHGGVAFNVAGHKLRDCATLNLVTTIGVLRRKQGIRKVNRSGYCIFIDTVSEDSVPSVRDSEDRPCVFATRIEAEREIADNLITRLQDFLDGAREFDDAISHEEYVVEVDICPDGAVIDCDGNLIATAHQA